MKLKKFIRAFDAFIFHAKTICEQNKISKEDLIVLLRIYHHNLKTQTEFINMISDLKHSCDDKDINRMKVKISTSIKKLTNDNFLKSTVSPVDNRVKIISISPRGYTVIKEMEEVEYE